MGEAREGFWHTKSSVSPRRKCKKSWQFLEGNSDTKICQFHFKILQPTTQDTINDCPLNTHSSIKERSGFVLNLLGDIDSDMTNFYGKNFMLAHI